MEQRPGARRRRRAVGPPGARPLSEPVLTTGDEHRPDATDDDDERLRRDRPPHHDRGV